MGSVVEKLKNNYRESVLKVDFKRDKNLPIKVHNDIKFTQTGLDRDFISNYFDLDNSNVIFLSSKKLLQEPENSIHTFRHVVQKDTLDSISNTDQFFRRLNKSILDAGIYICKITSSGIKDWNNLPSLGFPASKKRFTSTVHSYSFAEWLGRFFFYGFEVIEHRINGSYIIVAMIKTGDPKKDMEPSRNPLYKMSRVGYNGKMIGVYKIRTMYPFSEYLQEYIVKLNGYNASGKPAQDFRITNSGKLLRKFWLDEIPQILNVLKGEMKLVGVRPLSMARFKELPEHVQQERVKHKPGCIPPYVSLCMGDSKANIEAEIIYMDDKKKSPYLTDLRYFIKAVFNILTLRIVSS